MTVEMFPFDEHEELLEYSALRRYQYKTLDEARFTGTLIFLECKNTTFIFTNGIMVTVGTTPVRSRKYRFRLIDFIALIPYIVDGMITGTFIPVKQGNRWYWKLES
jgi:hypothetical protein